jgi:hypothetical protein
LGEKIEQVRSDPSLIFNQQNARWVIVVQPVSLQYGNTWPIQMVKVVSLIA